VTPLRVLAELESIAARVGIAVRVEPFGSKLLQGRGGLCWLHGQPLVVMDASLAAVDRIPLLAAALARFERALEGVYVAPAVRALIEAAREEGQGPAGRAARAAKRRRAGHPGLARTRPKGK
jgi:hypothetical protein